MKLGGIGCDCGVGKGLEDVVSRVFFILIYPKPSFVVALSNSSITPGPVGRHLIQRKAF